MSSFFQAVLSSTTAGDGCNATAQGTNATSPSSPAAPQDLSGLLAALIPFAIFAKLPDWIKLAIIGSIIETCRRATSWIWSYITQNFNLTAHFDSTDRSYDWVLFWLSQQSSFGKARDVEITTRSWGSRPNGYMVPGEEPEFSENGVPARELAYVPSPHVTYTLWFRGRYMQVTRTRSENQSYWSSDVQETLCVSIMTRDRRIMNELLIEAKKAYNAEQNTNVNIYVSDNFNEYWRHVAARPKRSLSSIVLDPGIAERVIADARDFLASRAWYAKRGIPFRRGYLLYGAPGSGKTSLIHSLAGELAVDVYVISLSQSGMDDNKLARLIAELPEKCIALMEDIDAAFHHGLNRDASGSSSAEDSATDPAGKPADSARTQSAPPAAANPPPVGSRITLSGLLNALDGVGAQEGRILFATTNKYASLDPALCRPGRMDMHVEFKLASRYQAAELFKCFFMPDEEEEVEEKEGEEVSPSRRSEKSEDSGYESVQKPVEEKAISPAPSSATGSIRGIPHAGSQPTLSKAQVQALATRFSEALPERQFSMAALQGYLMMYKIHPVEAVEEFAKWVEQEMKQREEKARRKVPKVEVKDIVADPTIKKESTPTPPAEATATATPAPSAAALCSACSAATTSSTM
ncbi:P-loop containing nucleoside triphosphate hydrolase protein [Punctularia strigosozonata HHB-11173 SS5]|uniref:P-loop containing nucleoside triphosphate hydrolase protein n=1 Tax=Punctularia strigosozonata (strain HHB-11173) TaxID=741275 RepID=UPI00044168F8|nr:P-loop containing nucleoside triphosphate hydrolase protein [Punctularia strigosozonata HHB-11173 SS5]EIN05401.1 P-loop containing nucleoside triphosphate hydrolase protein [Punctularia strigosozonata HHB-11173 SS5]